MTTHLRNAVAVVLVTLLASAGAIGSVGVPISQISNRSVIEGAVFGEAMVQVPTGVAAIIGVGPDASMPPISVSSVGDFQSLVSNPSPSLASAVEQFFNSGGAKVVLKGATDSTASAIITAAQSGLPPGADLLLAADLYALDPPDWIQAAVAMGSAAAKSLAIALIDIPQSVVESESVSTGSLQPLTSLAISLRAASGTAAGSMLLFASNLEDQTEAIVPASPSYAGLIAETDANEGFWNAPEGFGSVMRGVRPQLVVSRSDYPTLSDSGLNPFMYFPGRGGAVVSALLLSGSSDYLSVKRTLNTIQATVSNGLIPYVFSSNDEETWSNVIQATSGYLTELFTQGALIGANASDAFRVECGIGTTMTNDDIQNGFMNLAIGVAVTYPSDFDQILIKQVMQAPSA